jgi:histidyl-tRNA synthetase
MSYQPAKGTKDFLPEEMRKWQWVIDRIREVYERYGFAPLETPAFESFELLSAKGGLGEAVREEIYNFKDKGGRELGLRFDFTVPLARVLANNPNLPRPFKRYQIGKVWRYDNPQALRYREFWQADADTIGSQSMMADAECIAVAVDCLKAIGFKEFNIRVNNRKLIECIMEKVGVPKEKMADAFRSVDKMDKIGESGVERELDGKGIDAKKVLAAVRLEGKNEELLQKVEEKFGASEGLNELNELLKLAKQMGIEKWIKIDLSLVRGLDYYTGPVFEVALGGGVSAGGGGRYDKLIKVMGGPDLPATGISLGLSRVVALADEKGLLKADPPARVFVAAVNDWARPDVLKLVQGLRNDGITAETDIAGRKLAKQMEWAGAAGFPFVAIVGPEELKKGSVKLRDMKTGKERLVKAEKLGQEIAKAAKK